jgi:hypothetical protein
MNTKFLSEAEAKCIKEFMVKRCNRPEWGGIESMSPQDQALGKKAERITSVIMWAWLLILVIGVFKHSLILGGMLAITLLLMWKLYKTQSEQFLVPLMRGFLIAIKDAERK